MLVLSRGRDEEICIGNNVRVVVVEIRGDKVRLGVTAPREIPVHRAEVYDAIAAKGELIPNVSIAPSFC
jgi:carbon storage regulator